MTVDQTTNEENSYYQNIQDSLNPVRKSIIQHSLYSKLKTVDHIKTFMQTHVFSVWDFMSLVKALQNRFAGTKEPWLPKDDALIVRFINEIVLAEESDEIAPGMYDSHYGLYLKALKAIGGDSLLIETFLSFIKKGEQVGIALQQAEVPKPIQNFVETTFDVIQTGEAHKVAAAFTFGRENLIPQMFSEIVKEINQKEGKLDLFTFYLERHIEIDGESHGPLSQRMLSLLCKDDEKKWNDCLRVAERALQARLELWNFIDEQISRGSWSDAQNLEETKNTYKDVV